MPGIPTDHDRRLANIDMQARSILGHLTTLHWANPKDRERMRMTLRERLQDFCNDVMNAADQAGD
jgi:hypothetical protein